MTQDLTSLLSVWNWDPLTIVGMALILAVYLGVMFGYRPRYLPLQAINRTGMVYFLTSLCLIFLLQVSPLDMLSEKYLLVAHMVSHLTISNVVAPLMVLGMPAWWFDSILRTSFWKKLGRFLTNPPLAFMLFNINLLMWHYPPFYEATLANEAIHFIEHAAFLLTGLLFWWPLLSPTAELPRLPFAYRILYLFLASIPCTVLGVIFVFSPNVLYATYAAAPRITSLDPMMDQVTSGILMTTLDNLFYLGILSVVFFKWVGHENVSSAAKQNI